MNNLADFILAKNRRGGVSFSRTLVFDHPIVIECY